MWIQVHRNWEMKAGSREPNNTPPSHKIGSLNQCGVIYDFPVVHSVQQETVGLSFALSYVHHSMFLGAPLPANLTESPLFWKEILLLLLVARQGFSTNFDALHTCDRLFMQGKQEPTPVPQFMDVTTFILGSRRSVFLSHLEQWPDATNKRNWVVSFSAKVY